MKPSFCNFEDTGKVFRNKKVYRCTYCETQLALEDPNINIICFKKHNETMTALYNMDLEDKNSHMLNLHSQSDEHFKGLVGQQVDLQREPIPPMNPDQSIVPETSDPLCSKEQIDSRLNICNQCEHFKDHSCLLCGCVIVRDKNFNNKLAHKRHSCPINKWGPILDDPIND